MDDDQEFVLLCCRGEVEAFEHLVRKYEKKMFNIVYRIVSDYDDTCEIVQDSFLSAYRAIRTFKGESKFSTWLTAITMNHARNRLKQVKSKREVVFIEDSSAHSVSSGSMQHFSLSAGISAMERLEQEEIRQKVQECIGTIETDQREVLVLRDIEDFSYDEIRLLLKIPDGTVKSRLSRARNTLKECLRMKKVIGDL
ncbi:MAG TPA: RNA polymerase sigma factor [Syntrophorhabdaceae bacterium]|nr:RNA polymerase sigma factor [Syntrophorhabdaceae bacterium]